MARPEASKKRDPVTTGTGVRESESLKSTMTRRPRTGKAGKRATRPTLKIITDPVQSAKEAGLTYVGDDTPGITRRRRGHGFCFIGADGKPIRDEAELDRIRALGIPPAWTNVWICPKARGHIQATGRDARGRKQYRYHPRWRQIRDETKYHRMIAFGQALPVIRERALRALELPGLCREKVLGTVVRLLEATLIRVGNDEYARANASFGLTTMRDEHVQIDGAELRFHFRGKSGKEHAIHVRDRRLARIVKRCHDLPGHELFQYVDDNGERQRIHSGDVNDYLRELTGEDFTAKDFRTWAGTMLAARALAAFEAFDSQAQAKRNLMAAIESVAKRLGNTRTICRKCYIHPGIIDAYLDRSLIAGLTQRAEAELSGALSQLEPEEAAVMGLLHERLLREQEALSPGREARATAA
jgi:DNA topoisomerase-1